MGVSPLGAVFTTEIVIILLLMVVHAYFLTRAPVLAHLKEIYFANSGRFKEAWYLVIAGLTFFVIAQVVRAFEEPDLFLETGGRHRIYEIAFATSMILAFISLLRVFRKYIPDLRSTDEEMMAAIQEDLRRHVMDDAGQEVDVSIGEDIYQGRARLGPNVSLAHYRGIVLGMTQYMEARFGELGDSILFTVGRQTGRNAAREMLAESQDPERTQIDFIQAFQDSSIGLVSVSQEKDGRAVVAVEECVTCSGLPADGDTHCHYIGGALTGLYEVLWGTQVDTRETKCWGLGDRECEFRLRQKGMTVDG